MSNAHSADTTTQAILHEDEQFARAKQELEREYDAKIKQQRADLHKRRARAQEKNTRLTATALAAELVPANTTITADIATDFTSDLTSLQQAAQKNCKKATFFIEQILSPDIQSNTGKK